MLKAARAGYSLSQVVVAARPSELTKQWTWYSFICSCSIVMRWPALTRLTTVLEKNWSICLTVDFSKKPKELRSASWQRTTGSGVSRVKRMMATWSTFMAPERTRWGRAAGGGRRREGAARAGLSPARASVADRVGSRRTQSRDDASIFAGLELDEGAPGWGGVAPATRTATASRDGGV
jgi:hypothetical protein